MTDKPDVQRSANVLVKREGQGSFKKRKAEVQRPSSSEVTFLKTKKRKTEQDYHRGETANHLRSAENSACQGNRFMMEFYLKQAQEHHAKEGLVLSTINAKVNQIRRMLQNEIVFHETQLQNKLEAATKYALEGNRLMMDFSLREASKHALDAGQPWYGTFQKRSNIIRNSLQHDREVSFHEKNILRDFDDAQLYAEKGNGLMMDFKLREAKKHAEKVAGRLNTSFWREDSYIRSLLGSQVEFHKKEFHDSMKKAATYAGDGNRLMTEFALKQAQDHAMKAGCWDATAQKRAARLEKSLLSVPATITVKKEIAKPKKATKKNKQDGPVPERASSRCPPVPDPTTSHA